MGGSPSVQHDQPEKKNMQMYTIPDPRKNIYFLKRAPCSFMNLCVIALRDVPTTIMIYVRIHGVFVLFWKSRLNESHTKYISAKREKRCARWKRKISILVENGYS